MSVPKKKKHVSKKNKKAWRKHCDITDVEAFLEDQRLEERLGKFEAKPDTELFIFDTQGGNTAADLEGKPLCTRLSKRSKLSKTPKCFEILLPSSKVEDPNAKRNHVNPVGAKPTALSKIKRKRQFRKGVFRKKIELARKNRRLAVEKKKKVKQAKQNFLLDLWGEQVPEIKGIPKTLCDEFVSPEAQLHNVRTERRVRPKPLPSKTVATRAAIDVPHPGVSYNPSFKEHQGVLLEVVQHEQKMMKREAHLLRVTNGMFHKVTPAQKEDQWREEMSVGLAEPYNPLKDSLDSDSDNEYKAINPPVKIKKKDHKARRKQREQLEEKERLKREKINKKKITDIYKLRKIQSSILNNEQKQEEVRSKRKEKKTVKEATAVPTLNAHKAPKKEPDFVDPEQLTGDLRNVAAKTNLLRDRFESLQRRGLLAFSKLMMKKKRNLKSYFKPGHKVTEQEVERYIAKIRTAGKKTKKSLT